MTTRLTRTAAAATLGFLLMTDVAMAQTRPSIREAAARVSFTQTASAPKDSNANGTAIGALVGAAAMGTMLAVLWNSCGAGCENDLEPWAPYAAIGVGAAGGAAVGYLIDRARGGSRRKVTVAPAVTRRAHGIKVAVRF